MALPLMQTEKKNGWTALHWAIYTNATQAVELLIQKGADVNALGKIGDSPILTAVLRLNGSRGARGDTTMIRLLLDAGADPHIKNNYDVSAYDVAHRIVGFPADVLEK